MSSLCEIYFIKQNSLYDGMIAFPVVILKKYLSLKKIQFYSTECISMSCLKNTQIYRMMIENNR